MANTFRNSDAITLLDTVNPTVRQSAGRGGAGRVVNMRGSILTATNDATTIVYRMVRVPTNSFVESVKIITELNGGTNTTLTFNCGLYYSDAASPGDGTSAINIGNIAAISDAFFASAFAAAAVLTTPSDITFANSGGSNTDGFYVPTSSKYQLWDAVQNGGFGRVAGTAGHGYSSVSTGLWTTPANGGTVLPAPGDPGGWVDICLRPSSAVNVTVANWVTLMVSMVLGG